MIATGLTATLEFRVSPQDTARVLLSGDLDVLGTPRLLGWLEAATCAAVRGALDAQETTVGTNVAIEHRAASPVGSTVAATAVLTRVDGRALGFEVAAVDARTRTLLGRGEITRVVVDRERFLAALG